MICCISAACIAKIITTARDTRVSTANNEYLIGPSPRVGVLSNGHNYNHSKILHRYGCILRPWSRGQLYTYTGTYLTIATAELPNASLFPRKENSSFPANDCTRCPTVTVTRGKLGLGLSTAWAHANNEKTLLLRLCSTFCQGDR